MNNKQSLHPIEEWLELTENRIPKEQIEIDPKYLSTLSQLRFRLLQRKEDFFEWYPVKFESDRGIINYTYYTNINKKSVNFGKFLLQTHYEGSNGGDYGFQEISKELI